MVTAAVSVVMVPLDGTFLLSTGLSPLVRFGSRTVDDALPTTLYAVLMVSEVWVERPHEYGIESLQVFVVPVPVAATELLSLRMRGLPVVRASSTVVDMVHVTLVMPVDLTVTVMVRLIVPVKVVNASSESSTACVTGRNAPVCGSRYPRMPGFAELAA